MIDKLFRLILWVKGNGIAIVGLVASLILIVGIIQTNRANKWEREHLRLEGRLEEQLKDQDLFYGEAERQRAIRRLEREEEKKVREILEARIQIIEDESKKAKIALEQEKKKTATLPPIQLVKEINQRIGQESSLTGTGLFLFTRIGTNRTLDRFKDGEFYLSEFNRHSEIIKDHETKAESFGKSLADCEEGEAENLVGWEDCRETLDTALDDIEALKKVKSAIIWKGRCQGAIGGSIITIVGCKLLGIF